MRATSPKGTRKHGVDKEMTDKRIGKVWTPIMLLRSTLNLLLAVGLAPKQQFEVTLYNVRCKLGGVKLHLPN